MIKSENTKMNKKEVLIVGIAYPLIVGILLIYREWFTNPSPFFSRKNLLFLETKSHFPYQILILPYQGLIIQEVRDLEARKFVDRYLLRISRLYPFIHSELAISKRTVGWGTWNSRRAALKLTSGRILRLS